MRTVGVQKIAELQKNPANIRNICILAHVDHGKTTLADTLVASNGIISQRMAGKLRYLDSRADEQERGITMKASAISLLHVTPSGEEHLINLIDSPGHIDFSSEVSTAVRLCDGALVVVDVVEGVCPQTAAVLRQAWLEGIKPVLFLNKLDRLISELRLSPAEAHTHLQQLLEQVNAITGELFTTDVLQRTGNQQQEQETSDGKPAGSEQVYEWSAGLEHTDDSHLYFSPDQGNVVFGSAIDGWGFGLEQFAQLYASKLGIKPEVLRRTLWGDFYLDAKSKRVRAGAKFKGKKPLFVQFILDNVWAVYDAVMEKRDKERIDKMVSALGLKISARDSRHTDRRVHLQAITSQWLPLSQAVLELVVSRLPSPVEMSGERVERLLCPADKPFRSLPQQTQDLKDAFLSCSSAPEAPVIVFVSKMFSVDASSLPRNRPKALTAEELAERRQRARERHAERMAARAAEQGTTNGESQGTDSMALENGTTEIHSTTNTQTQNGTTTNGQEEGDESGEGQVFLAFARVFSGTVRKGQPLYVLGPKHNPATALQLLKGGGGGSVPHVTPVTLEQLYLFMGRELEELPDIPAGNILGLGGLEAAILKSATVSDALACPAFTDMHLQAAPIVRVAVEPTHPGAMRALSRGLRLLNQADPCVEVLVAESGEHVILAAGEVHLNKCITDLTQRFAQVEVNVSEPIVPFRETIIPPPTMDRVNEEIAAPAPADPEEGEPGVVDLTTPNRKSRLRLRALPLPAAATKLLEDEAELLRTLDQHDQQERLAEETRAALAKFKAALRDALEAEEEFKGVVEDIWAFGPRRTGPNLLVNRVEGYDRPSVWGEEGEKGGALRQHDNSVVSGFQLATLAGPMCEEPMMGVAFFVEEWTQRQEKRSVGEEAETQGNVAEIIKEVSSTIEEVEEEASTDGSGSEGDELEENMAELELNENSKESVERTENAECSERTSHQSTEMRSRRRELYGPMSGQLMSIVKEGCRKAFQSQPQRLCAAMYTCHIQCTAEALGKMYGVLGRRNGRILEEDMREGSSTFLVTAVLPVRDSFGFAEEIRKRTSGLASPQLRFTHWEVLGEDPYWVPCTEEELLHFGEKADSANQAYLYMRDVRRRKGLKVREQLVECAEKQRTLSRNK